jgi:hypothetical protein
MSGRTTSGALWRTTATVGVSLIVIGLGVLFIDSGTNDLFEFISHNSEAFGDAFVVGVFLSFVGLIGWAVHLRRKIGARMAANVFAWPWITLLIGFGVDGLNMHGTAASPLRLFFQPRC